MIHSAGLAVVYQKKLLLVHPAGAVWHGTFSIPKGLVKGKATYIETAIRETFEEVGIEIGEGWIDKTENVIDYRNRHTTYKKLHWYKADISNISFNEINHFFPSFSRDQLQLSEVDYASFMNIDDALQRIFWRHKPILDIL